MIETHCIFISKKLLLIVMLSVFVFIIGVQDQYRKAIVLYSNCEYFTSHRKVQPRFHSLLSVRFEFQKVMRISCTHQNQLKLIRCLTAFLLHYFYCNSLLCILFQSTVDLSINKYLLLHKTLSQVIFTYK